MRRIDDLMKAIENKFLSIPSEHIRVVGFFEDFKILSSREQTLRESESTIKTMLLQMKNDDLFGENSTEKKKIDVGSEVLSKVADVLNLPNIKSSSFLSKMIPITFPWEEEVNF